MSTETKRIELHVDSDPRLASGVGGAVRYWAELAGLPEEVCREFQEETVRACVKIFGADPGRSHAIELLTLADRVEVVVDGDSGASAVRLTRSLVSQH